jgi:nucleoside recognition membrane protein YjiH
MVVFIVIGIILIVISFTLKNDNVIKVFESFKIIGLGLTLLGVFSSAFKQIDAGKVGVKSLYGNVESSILESGLHN